MDVVYVQAWEAVYRLAVNIFIPSPEYSGSIFGSQVATDTSETKTDVFYHLVYHDMTRHPKAVNRIKVSRELARQVSSGILLLFLISVLAFIHDCYNFIKDSVPCNRLKMTF